MSQKKFNKSIDELVSEFQNKYQIIGRSREIRQAILAKLSNKHILIEGEVGVGKTTISRALADFFDQNFYRIDGDERFTESKLVGYFDPLLVLKNGYNQESFIAGPLTSAMKNGGILFINELNRLPERTQNVLLSTLDEGILIIPKLENIKAAPGFSVIATQNPSEHVGVGILGEAIKDRFIWIKLDYQSFEEEIQITKLKTESNQDGSSKSNLNINKIIENSVKIVRLTRESPQLRRGSSVRGAIDIVSILKNVNNNYDLKFSDWLDASIMCLVPKIDLEDGVEVNIESIIESLVSKVINGRSP